MKILRLLALSVSVALLVIATLAGMLVNYLFLFLPVVAFIMIVTVIAAALRKQTHLHFTNMDSVRTHVLRGCFRNVVWIVVGVCVHNGLVPIQFSQGDLTTVKIIIWGSVFTLCLLDWIPRKQAGSSLNVTLTVFLITLSYQLAQTYLPSRSDNIVESSYPFKGHWYVLQGGNSALMNHHHFSGSQKYALDFIVTEDGKLPLENETDMEMYKTFGRSLYSPVEGVITAVENSLPDQKIGETDRENLAGNHVVIDTGADIYVLLGHLQNSSVLVAVGDTVKIGQQIARVGNSGNTSQPHLHIQAMTNMDYMSPDSGPVPIVFKNNDEKESILMRNSEPFD